MKVPVGGGALTFVASGETDPSGVAVDDRCVYWTNTEDGTVKKVAKEDGLVRADPAEVGSECRAASGAAPGGVWVNDFTYHLTTGVGTLGTPKLRVRGWSDVPAVTYGWFCCVTVMLSICTALMRA